MVGRSQDLHSFPTRRSSDLTPFNQILKQNAKREMRLRLGKVTVADVLAAQPVTTKRRLRSEERFSRNAETDLVCRLLLEKRDKRQQRCGLLRGSDGEAARVI